MDGRFSLVNRRRPVRLEATGRRLVIVAAVWLTGCGGEVTVKAPARVANATTRDGGPVVRMQTDPLAYLRQLRTRCTGLERYTCRFYRQERLGLFPKLTKLEEIDVKFRRAPFSVKFDWIEPDRYDGRYYESVYFAGRNDGKLVVRERIGVFPFPPKIQRVSLTLPVKVGRSKNPITDFGLGRMMERSLEPIEDPALAGDIAIEYEGVVRLETIDRRAHHLAIRRPVVGKWIHARQDFYIDTETLLPAGTDLWLPNGQLDARYRYTDVNLDATLTDADFRLGKGHADGGEDRGLNRRDAEGAENMGS